MNRPQFTSRTGSVFTDYRWHIINDLVLTHDYPLPCEHRKRDESGQYHYLMVVAINSEQGEQGVCLFCILDAVKQLEKYGAPPIGCAYCGYDRSLYLASVNEVDNPLFLCNDCLVNHHSSKGVSL